jgi:nucleoside-diphosphate-sugar epimerase
MTRTQKSKDSGRILVTGATGFIGRHLVEALCRRGEEIVCLVLPEEPAGFLEKLKVKIVRGDVTDAVSLREAVKGVKTIYHLAAVLVSENTGLFYCVNFQGTKNLIEACKAGKAGLERFLFVSSISAFGPTGKEIKNEDSSSDPVNDYGKSKLQAEAYLKSDENPYPFTIVRPVEIYGPGRLDTFYHVCQAAQFGIMLRLGKGEVTLGYVDDIVDGILRACNDPRAVGETYLLGENRVYTINEVIRHFSFAVRKRLIRVWIPYSVLYSLALVLEIFARLTRTTPLVTRWQLKSYMKQFYWKFDISKAGQDLDFQARVSLEEGAAMTVAWYKKEGLL